MSWTAFSQTTSGGGVYLSNKRANFIARELTRLEYMERIAEAQKLQITLQDEIILTKDTVITSMILTEKELRSRLAMQVEENLNLSRQVGDQKMMLKRQRALHIAGHGVMFVLIVLLII